MQLKPSIYTNVFILTLQLQYNNKQYCSACKINFEIIVYNNNNIKRSLAALTGNSYSKFTLYQGWHFRAILENLLMTIQLKRKACATPVKGQSRWKSPTGRVKYIYMYMQIPSTEWLKTFILFLFHVFMVCNHMWKSNGLSGNRTWMAWKNDGVIIFSIVSSKQEQIQLSRPPIVTCILYTHSECIEPYKCCPDIRLVLVDRTRASLASNCKVSISKHYLWRCLTFQIENAFELKND
jgi:hypothetical protein